MDERRGGWHHFRAEPDAANRPVSAISWVPVRINPSHGFGRWVDLWSGSTAAPWRPRCRWQDSSHSGHERWYHAAGRATTPGRCRSGPVAGHPGPRTPPRHRDRVLLAQYGHPDLCPLRPRIGARRRGDPHPGGSHHDPRTRCPCWLGEQRHPRRPHVEDLPIHACHTPANR